MTFEQLEAKVFAAAFYDEFEKVSGVKTDLVKTLITKITGPGKVKVKVPKVSITRPKPPKLPSGKPIKVKITLPKVKIPKIKKVSAASLPPKQYVEKGELPQLLKNIAIVGAGTAVGTGLGYGGRALLRRWAKNAVRTGNTKTISRMLPLIGGAGGGAVGVGIALADKKRRQKAEELITRARRRAREQSSR